MGREHISPWRRTRRRHDAFRRRRKAAWSRARTWADYIIATNDAPRDGHQSTLDSVLTPSACLRGAVVHARPASVRGYRVRTASARDVSVAPRDGFARTRS